MSKISLRAVISEFGKLIPEAPGVWAAAVGRLSGKRVTVTIETESMRRSNQQNRYWRGVVVPYFVDVWSSERRYPQGLPPYDPEQVHDILVKHISGYEEEDGPLGEPVRKKTRFMDTAEMTKLIDGARELAMHEYKSTLPAPGEEYDALEVA